jgi:hypothetical protein
MTDQNFQSYLHLVKRAAIHSQQFRHTNYSSRNLPNDAIEDIGFQLVSLFEELYEKRSGGEGGGTPPKKGTSKKSGGWEDAPAHPRPQPYR